MKRPLNASVSQSSWGGKISMAVRVVRLGSDRAPNEGTRIGTVRHPPRGVPKDQHAAQNWYDAWLPELAPSSQLAKFGQAAELPLQWATLVKRGSAEMAAPDNSHRRRLFATMSRRADCSAGPYC